VEEKALNTYVCDINGLICEECRGSIPSGASFAVASTPSKPSKVNCMACADGKEADQSAGRNERERGLRFE